MRPKYKSSGSRRRPLAGKESPLKARSSKIARLLVSKLKKSRRIRDGDVYPSETPFSEPVTESLPETEKKVQESQLILQTSLAVIGTPMITECQSTTSDVDEQSSSDKLPEGVCFEHKREVKSTIGEPVTIRRDVGTQKKGRSTYVYRLVCVLWWNQTVDPWNPLYPKHSCQVCESGHISSMRSIFRLRPISDNNQLEFDVKVCGGCGENSVAHAVF